MRGLLAAVVVVAVVLLVLGFLLKALKWLIILGALGVVIAVILGIVQGRRGPAR